MMFEYFLSMRHIRSKKNKSFISAISFLSIAGIMMGIMAMIVVLSVMNGLKKEFLHIILGLQSHVTVNTQGLPPEERKILLKDIRSVEGVLEISPSIDKKTLINWSAPAELRGIDPDSISKVVDIDTMIKSGNISTLKTYHDGVPSIFLGCDLAAKLDVGAGDKIRLMTLNTRITPLVPKPNYGDFIVTGIIESGSADIDLSLAVASLKDVQKLFSMKDRISSFEIKVEDADKSDIISQKIREKTGSLYFVHDWKYRNQNLLAALQIDKYCQFIICLMIVLVGALNIISALVMTVMDKSRDIAILRTMGATKKSIMAVFMIEGLFAGMAGTIAGICSGLGICYILSKYEISLPSGLYPMSTIPVQVQSLDVAAVAFSGLLIAFLATIYPSWRASVLNPIETLRYE